MTSEDPKSATQQSGHPDPTPVSNPDPKRLMRIPVFVSCPNKSNLTEEQEGIRKRIEARYLARYMLEARALGKTDYPVASPLGEVAAIGRHCAGAIILGFSVCVAKSCQWSEDEGGNKAKTRILSTEWNNLEAGILFGIGLPMLIFRDTWKDPADEGKVIKISGGVFDEGVSDVFIHDMPEIEDLTQDKPELRQIFLKWHARVLAHYYRRPVTL